MAGLMYITWEHRANHKEFAAHHCVCNWKFGYVYVLEVLTGKTAGAATIVALGWQCFLQVGV